METKRKDQLKPKRPGIGALTYDLNHSHSIVANDFLFQLGKVAIQVLADLSNAPLSLFNDAYETAEDREKFWMYRHPQRKADDETQAAKILLIHDQLRQWAARWNLEALWIYEWAFMTLEMWSQSPDLKGTNYTAQIHSVSAIAPIPGPPMGLPWYFPSTESVKAYADRVRDLMIEKFEHDPSLALGEPSQRNAFIGSIVQRAVGYAESVIKYQLEHNPTAQESTEAGRFNDHITWTVKFQVLGHSYAQIAREEKLEIKSETYVKRSIQAVLEILQIDPRQVLRGRRPGVVEGKSRNIADPT